MVKLKKALKVAKYQGFNWVAVDMNGDVFAYTERPEPDYTFHQWFNEEAYGSHKYLGKYTGSKAWRDTLRST